MHFFISIRQTSLLSHSEFNSKFQLLHLQPASTRMFLIGQIFPRNATFAPCEIFVVA